MTATLLPPDLPAVALDELVENAALLTRIDRKYVLHRGEAQDVLRRLAERCPGAAPVRTLEIDGRREQQYESVYFDTPELLSYRMAAHGRRRRFKVRTRSYVDSRLSFVEVKSRGERGTTIKEREPLAEPADDSLEGTARRFADAALSRAGQEAPERLALHPVLTVGYHRTTLYLPSTPQHGPGLEGGHEAGVREEPAARTTVDSELVWRTADGTSLEIPDLVIVETKSGSRPSQVDRLLWRHGHRPARVSKFGTGMAVLDPRLPANKWSRTIGRLGQIARR